MNPFLKLTAWKYRHILKPILFKFDSETVHDALVGTGEVLGGFISPKFRLFPLSLGEKKALFQEIDGIKFESPIGLAAGFDYRAKLVRLLPALGFGFQTVGTITNLPYEGNPSPRLGRLIRSRSLLVNKGFKNDGIDATLEKLANATFGNAVGLSIGQTNSPDLTQEGAKEDILSSFRKAESSSVPFSYYELNISCPNLRSSVSFYPPEKLKELLTAVFSLGLTRPLFVKMPIDRTDEEALAMLRVISDSNARGVIFGNLEKNRENPLILKEESVKYERGNFSGKPTEKRSNELVSLAYRNFGGRLIVIGCGGVFSAEDAYKKIRLGASLVQLVTGLIFEGPQLVAEIDHKLPELLARDGFGNVSEAVGIDSK